MDEEDKRFYERSAKIEAFKMEMKSLFAKHKIELVEDTESWHGGSKEVLRVYLDGEDWVSNDFEELLQEASIIS